MRLLSRRGNNRNELGGGVFRPQITSLIDVMTILLIFLIKNFAVDSDVVSPPSNIALPFSSSDKAAQSRCAVTITKDEIIVDDRVAARTAEAEASDSLVIAPLYAALKTIQPICQVDGKGALVILCDKDVNFAAVKKIMATSSRAGITEFSILVLREGE